MPLVYLVLLVAMMFCGGMLITLNPSPVAFNVGWRGETFQVSASILEIIGYSVVAGAALAAVLTLRNQLLSARDRRRAERESERLRAEATTLRREAADAKSEAALLVAQLAEVREAYAALEAESRPLLTMQAEAPEPIAPAVRPTPYPKRRAANDEAKRSKPTKTSGKPRRRS